MFNIVDEDYELSAYWTDPRLVDASHPPLSESRHREPLWARAEAANPGGLYVFILKEGISLLTYIKPADGQQAINSLTPHMSGCIHNVSGLGVRDTVSLCCLIKCNQNKTIVF